MGPVERSLQMGATLPGGQMTETTDPWENLIKRNTGSNIQSMQDIDGATAVMTTRQKSADFHSFQTVAGQKDNLNVRQVHDIQLAPDLFESDSPLLLSVGSSLSYGPQQPSGMGSSIAVGSVGKADFIHRQMLTTPDGTSLAYGNMAVYGKMSEKPSAPLEHLEDIDSRLLEKTALLEEK